MFRSRKKRDAKDAAEGVGRGSSDVEHTPITKSSKTFRLGKKKEEPEPKLELDLENALPSSDDFRTSLLMNGLSARFSMLREQDDPTSKIGKASDDSVLFPKRASKLIDFGFQGHGLSDIAEVSSIHGSVRPPIAFLRTDSYGDGYGTDDESVHTGSIMSRPKPGEGNILFGGRQKIYKIPAGSKSSGDGVGLGGRVLYDNDVSQSAFQKLREKEREQQWEERNDDEDNNADMSTAGHSRAGSPPLAGYNRNRETSSTTSSGPINTRSSTAATSITSQRTPSLSGSHTPVSAGGSISNFGMDRSSTKMRRLYENGLDQHVHDQQHSTMNRIDTLTRQRGMGSQTPPLTMNSPTSTTTHNAADKWDRKPVLAKGSMPELRAASPPPNYGLPSPISGFDFGPIAKSTHLAVEPKSQYGFSNPPLSPPVSENDEAAPPSQANDGIKAMMTNAPPKSGQQYDENKNHQQQHQFQMKNGRETSPPRKHSPPGPFVPRQQPGPRVRTDSGATDHPHQRHFPPKDRAPELQSPKQPRIIIPGSETSPVPFIGSPNGRPLASPTRSEFSTKSQISRPWGLPQPRSFPNLKYRNHQDPSMTPRPDESQHPANQPTTPATRGPQQPLPAPPSSPPKYLEIKTTPPDDGERQPESPADSPTLPGLSGMVRSHLRSDSDSSSIYGITSSGFNQQIFSNPIEQATQDSNERRNPWDINDWDETPESPFVKVNSAVPAPLAVMSTNLDTEVESTPKAAWELEMESRHNRDGSSATQQERQEFRDELAQRRRQVQENLKSLVIEPERQPERQITSPTPGSAVLLKTKASLGALALKQKEAAGQSKAMKLFGMSSNPIPQNGPPQPFKQRIDDNSWKDEEEEMLRNAVNSTPPQVKAFRQARRDAQRDREHQIFTRNQQNGESGFNEISWSNPRPSDPRQAHPYEPRQLQGMNDGFANSAPRQRAQSRERKPPPVTHSQRNANRESKGSIATNNSGSRPASRTSRDRSGSDASGRSKSRNGRYRDDLAKAMAEGTGSSSQGVVEDLQNARLMLKPTASGISPGSSPGFPPGLSGRPSPLPSPSMGSGPRSNMKAQASSYFEPQHMQALQTGDALEIGISPRPSPLTPFSVHSTPSLIDPSSIGPRSTTPTSSMANGHIAARKKSITKSEISEPTFISSTSRISTINLPPGSSLQNGIVPPIPAVNPRRRQTRAMFGAIMGKKDSSEYLERNEISLNTQSSEEMSTFSDEEVKPKEKQKQRLRKSSSEGGNLNVKAREKAYNAPSPAMPDFPPGIGAARGPTPVQDGSMF
ncbi:hypothetical protein SBOR_3354 [Sclerotinia borealis F-4128]|uniref:Uncharacterized protein n=1 Tax=Sclerotinia borealis (strain F-4128) TaxID=1432307 RepID=W9CNX4_SCLBF|nr:hypothetical protein SBOR_3354 [Sclerotinia borealis F-4128]